MSKFVWPRHLEHGPELVQEWICRRLFNLGNEEIRYEASFSGPHNVFLQSYFQPGHRLMVKPIPRIRTLVNPGEAAGRSSKDSYEQNVQIRADDSIPDFIVCASGPDLHKDRPLLFWELKRDALNEARRAKQTIEIEKWIAAYQSQSGHNILPAPGRVYLAIVEKGLVTVTEYDPTTSMVFTWVCDVLSSDMDKILKDILSQHLRWLQTQTHDLFI